jgi:hypothetical protein
LVNTDLLYGRRKISDLRSALPDLEHVLSSAIRMIHRRQAHITFATDGRGE